MNRAIHIILLCLSVLALFMPYLSINFNGETLLSANGFDLMLSLPIESESEDFNFLLGMLDPRVAEFLSGQSRQWDLFLLGISLLSCISIGLSFVKDWAEKPVFATIYLVNIALIFTGKQVYLGLWEEQTAAFFKNLPEEMADMIPKNMVLPEFGTAWWAVLFINSIGIIWMIWRLIEIRRDQQLTIYKGPQN
jgi:hypothetical protein